MQLKYIFSLAMFVVIGLHTNAQNADTSKIHLEDITIDFVSSYYQQDGNNSPVTGGRGTEQLSDIANIITINVPVDTIRSLSVKGGVDFYSSASSDNINNELLLANHVSSASASDTRGYFTIGGKIKNNQRHTSKGVSLGFSQEYDVTSLSVGGSYSKASKDNNREISFYGNYFYDTWKLIYPFELRGNGVDELAGNVRQTFSLSTTGSFILNKKMQASLSSDAVFQSGLLSTPFHRVYFTEQAAAKIERLPNSRLKLPVALRFNYFINDFFVLRAYYRYYWDNWGVNAHTINLEVPIKVSNSFVVYPFYRYHQQSTAKYFGAYKTHSVTDEFYTSDYDLAGLNSSKYGVGFRYSPLYGLGRFKVPFTKSITLFKSIDLRYSHYTRNNGLIANSVAFHLNIAISQ